MYKVDWKAKQSRGYEMLDKDELASILRSIAKGIEEHSESEHRITHFSYEELDV